MNPRSSCILVLFACLTNVAMGQVPDEVEVAMKAETLANLPRYVEWPEGAFVIPGTPLMLGVYGHSEIHRRLVATFDGKTVNGRRVMVRRYRWPQAPNCHVLFIARSERHRLPWVMKKLRYSTTLTVAEFDDFLTHGGILRLSMKDDKVRFHVNTATARDVGLRFSSQFLSVADQVVGESKPTPK